MLKRLRKFMRTNKSIALPKLKSYQETEAAIYFDQLMRDRYSVNQLESITQDEFRKYITSLPGKVDAEVEEFADPNLQRDQSVRFEWGHDHDFGTFQMQGQMGNRHIVILSAFVTQYNVMGFDLSGKKVLDIGCWTGGTSLLLAALGADVFAIEEVRKYADTVKFIKKAFNIPNLQISSRSLYSLDTEKFFDQFDYVLYSGVLYHVTDPILSLRIVFNALKDGGVCLLETMAIDRNISSCDYHGAQHTLNQVTEGKLPRVGWNWFIPSILAIERMMEDVGFKVVNANLHKDNRALAVGIRNKHVDMLRAGLSKPSIR